MLLKTASGRGYRLLGSWTVRHQDASRQPVGLQPFRESRRSPGTNLPVVVTPLVGLSAAVHRIQDLLSAHRAVTLTGPVGSGRPPLPYRSPVTSSASLQTAGGWSSWCRCPTLISCHLPWPRCLGSNWAVKRFRQKRSRGALASRISCCFSTTASTSSCRGNPGGEGRQPMPANHYTGA
jgi:hypothetical protein